MSAADRGAFAGRRCVVTGGLGFIGSNLALALGAAGARVVVVDDLKDGHGGDRANVADAGAAVEVVIADIGDAAAVAPALAGADYVFDLAGQVSHIASVHDPERDLALNTTAQLRFLEIARRACPDARMVYSSTRQVYGRVRELPVTEATTPQPTDVNGVAKLAAEHLHLLPGGRAEPSAVLRLSNVYGPRQHLGRGDLGVLPVFVARALRGEPLVLFGDGAEERDPLHVEDVVEALLLAALIPGAAGRVFNIGHRDRLSVADIARVISAAAGGDPPEPGARWPADHARVKVGSIHLSSERARDELGWSPAVAFSEGMAQTLAWFRAHPERYA